MNINQKRRGKNSKKRADILRGKEFQVERVDFAEKYFGVTELNFE